MIKGITFTSMVLSLATGFIVGCSRDADAAKASADSPPKLTVRNETTPQNTVDDPLGGSESPSDLASKADLPLYPGAEAPDGMSNVRTTGAETRYEIILSTPDSVSKVYGFYRNSLKNPQESGGGKSLMGMTPKGNYAIITAVRGEDKTAVTIVVNAENSPTPSGGTSGG